MARHLKWWLRHCGKTWLRTSCQLAIDLKGGLWDEQDAVTLETQAAHGVALFFLLHVESILRYP